MLEKGALLADISNSSNSVIRNEKNTVSNILFVAKSYVKKKENDVTENKIAVVVYEQKFFNLTGGHLAEL